MLKKNILWEKSDRPLITNHHAFYFRRLRRQPSHPSPSILNYWAPHRTTHVFAGKGVLNKTGIGHYGVRCGEEFG
jgi:hypothetical protein